MQRPSNKYFQRPKLKQLSTSRLPSFIQDCGLQGMRCWQYLSHAVGILRQADVHRCFCCRSGCCLHRRCIRFSSGRPRAERRSAALTHATLAADFSIVYDRHDSMTIPFGEPEPSDDLLNQSMWSTRLRRWLDTRLRTLAADQRIQDARALRNEFVLD